MAEPTREPIGLNLTRTAKVAGQAFEDAMAEAGGSASIWQILLTLKTKPVANQRELAEVLGIQSATLTYHLNSMELDGMVTRTRDPSNRRVHIVTLTKSGESMFFQLRNAALAFDALLHVGLKPNDVSAFERVLARLRINVTGTNAGQ